MQNYCSDMNQLSHAMITLAQYCLKYPEVVSKEMLEFSTNSFISIENFTPDNMQFAQNHILLICSLINDETIEAMNPDFPFILDKIFLQPDILPLSKIIIKFADLMIKIACLILVDDDTENPDINHTYSPLAHEITSDGIQFVLSLVANESVEFPEERSFLLYSLFEHRLTSFEGEDAEVAFLNVLNFGEQYYKYCLKIIYISGNFGLFDENLTSVARNYLKNSNSPENNELKIIALELFEKFLEVDSEACGNQVLCFDTFEFFEDLIQIIFSGNFKLTTKVGKLMAGIMMHFPGIFGNPDLWRFQIKENEGLAMALNKLIEVYESIPNGICLIAGLKYIHSYISTSNPVFLEEFRNILEEAGVHETLDSIDTDNDDDNDIIHTVLQCLFLEE